MSAPGRPCRLLTADGVSLEARWDLPAGDARAAVVLCHPHPRYGGTMDLPLLRTVAACLSTAGGAVLRFNFRGVGASGGAWGGGTAEVRDVAAAAAEGAASFPGLPLGVGGWSFGAVAALRWQAETSSAAAYAGIAPPLLPGLSPAFPDPALLAPARRLFLVGDRDRLADAAALGQYAEAAGARVQVLRGSDHFFFGREHRVGEAVAAHLIGSEG